MRYLSRRNLSTAGMTLVALIALMLLYFRDPEDVYLCLYKSCCSAAFFHDRIAIGTAFTQNGAMRGSIVLFDSNSKRKVLEIDDNEMSHVRQLSYSPDESALLSWSGDGLCWWDPYNGTLLRRKFVVAAYVLISPNGKYYSSVGSGDVHVFRSKSQEKVLSVENQGEIEVATFCDMEERLAVITKKRTLLLIDLQVGTVTSVTLENKQATYCRIVDDGEKVVVGDRDAWVAVIDFSSGKILNEMSTAVRGIYFVLAKSGDNLLCKTVVSDFKGINLVENKVTGSFTDGWEHYGFFTRSADGEFFAFLGRPGTRVMSKRRLEERLNIR